MNNLALNLIKEYLILKGFLGTLKKLDEETFTETTDESTAQRKQLLKVLNIKWDNAKVGANSILTVLEIVLQYFVEKNTSSSIYEEKEDAIVGLKSSSTVCSNNSEGCYNEIISRIEPSPTPDGENNLSKQMEDGIKEEFQDFSRAAIKEEPFQFFGVKEENNETIQNEDQNCSTDQTSWDFDHLDCPSSLSQSEMFPHPSTSHSSSSKSSERQMEADSLHHHIPPVMSSPDVSPLLSLAVDSPVTSSPADCHQAPQLFNTPVLQTEIVDDPYGTFYKTVTFKGFKFRKKPTFNHMKKSPTGEYNNQPKLDLPQVTPFSKEQRVQADYSIHDYEFKKRRPPRCGTCLQIGHKKPSCPSNKQI